MKSCTLQQPYGTLIAIGAKLNETRWHGFPHHTGPLAIHAGKTDYANAPRIAWDMANIALTERGQTMPRGAAIAIVNTIACLNVMPDTKTYTIGGETITIPPPEPERSLRRCPVAVCKGSGSCQPMSRRKSGARRLECFVLAICHTWRARLDGH